MYIHHQVGPDVVNGLQVVFLDDTLQQDLHPRRHTHDNANIPLGGFFYHKVHLLGPIFLLRNLLTGFVELLKPRWNLARRDARKVARIVAKLLVVLQVGAATDHQDAAVVEVHREVVTRGRHQLTDTCTCDFVVKAFGDGYVLAGSL